MGQVIKHECDKCSRLLTESDFVVNGSINSPSGKVILKKGSYCLHCTQRALDPGMAQREDQAQDDYRRMIGDR